MTEPRKAPRDRGNDSPMTKARIAAGMTQKQLADMIGCQTRDISRWERGHHVPRSDTLAKIAQALGCSMDNLI